MQNDVFLIALSERNIPNLFQTVMPEGALSEKVSGEVGVAYMKAKPQLEVLDNYVQFVAEAELYLGYGVEELFVTNCRELLKPLVYDFSVLPKGCDVKVSRRVYSVVDCHGEPVELERHSVVEHIESSGPEAPYRSHLEQAIYSQPDVLAELLGTPLERELVKAVEAASHIYLVGCGSSHNAALIAQHWFEYSLNKVCSVDVASEFVARDPYLAPGSVVIGLSQSGETGDTVDALLLAAARDGIKTVAVTANSQSRLAKQASCVQPLPIGRERGAVASKSFSGELALLFNVALSGFDTIDNPFAKQLSAIPGNVLDVLNQHTEITALASQLRGYNEFFVLGQGVHFGLAKELALKLRELCGTYANAVPLGEFKHGNLALANNQRPVILINPKAKECEKTIRSIRKVSGRSLPIIVFTSSLNEIPDSLEATIITLPVESVTTEVFVYTVAVQLLALEIAYLNGRAVDELPFTPKVVK